MTNVSFGRHSKIIALPSEQNRIRMFYRDVLGCKVTKESEKIDYFRMGNDFFIAVLYEDSVLSQSDLLKSIRLEIRTDNPEELRQKIIEFGVKELDTFDKEHLYFQAPGGQVFRLVGKTEDMSRFER
jgi:catechol 2,3-dioxygenase-like lactoylglutathione lyase family enzyme